MHTKEQIIEHIKSLMKIEDVIIKKNFSKIKYYDGKNLNTIPVIIISRDRVLCLKELIERLKSLGMENIYVIDNNSTYQPLLDYYENEKISVFYLNKNFGKTCLWKTNIFNHFKNDYYIYTDPDTIPTDDIPNDFLNIMMNILKKYSKSNLKIEKVGLGIKIDDLPDCYKFKDEVIKHESNFWKTKVEENVYYSPIDSTFALYKPNSKGAFWLPCLRLGNCLVKHTTWYQDSENLDEEEIYYKKHLNFTHWSRKN